MKRSVACFLVGAVGAALCGFAFLTDRQQFFFSYLFAYVFWAGVSLGALGLLMIHHLTDGGWGVVIHRFLEAMIGVLPTLALLFAPICFGLPQLYRWARPEPPDAVLARKLFYLNAPAFCWRAAMLFLLWIGLAFLLRRRPRALSGPGLVLFALLGTVASVDWVMVLESDWTSTIFPVQMMIGQMLSALSLAIVLLVRGRQESPEFHRLGNLLLAFVMLWAYMSVSQLIIIWSGNLPREITWYLHRVAGGWKGVAVFLALFHFAVPFAVLLWREAKRRPRVLGRIALGVFLVHALEVFWQVAPSLHPTGLAVTWTDGAAFIGIGGTWSGVFCWRLGKEATHA